MEEVRVLGKLQLDTEGGLVPADGSSVAAAYSVPIGSRRRSRAGRKMAVAGSKEAAGSFTGGIGATKGNKEAAGSFTGEIGATKVNKEAAGSFTGEIGATKVNKEAAGSFTGEIGAIKVTKEAVGSFTGEIGATKVTKEAAGSFTGEIGATKVTKEAAGSFTDEIAVTKGAVTKEASGSFTDEIAVTKGNKEGSGTGMPLVGSEKPKEESILTKETVPESYITRIKARPMRRIPPLSDDMFVDDPRRRESIQAGIDLINYMVDVEEDCLRQYENKGFAEVGVAFVNGMKRMFILPN